MQPDQRHPELGNLTSLQNAAVDILLTGSTITDAAGKVGVTRRTLHRWLTDDPHFNAELNKRRNDLSRAVDDRLRAIAMAALDTVENAVTSGNVQASLAVLRGIGALDRRRSLPMNDDPAALAVQAELLAQTIMQCEKGVESETSAASPPETREERVESETRTPPSRAVLRPDTRPETPRPNKLHSPHPIPDPLPSNFRDTLGQSETFADSPNPNTPASPAHRPASDFQLLTSNSQLLTSTSPPHQAPPPKTREKRVESETSPAPNRPDTRRETPIPNRRPNTLHSPHPIPDPLPSNFRDTLGQSETFAPPSRAVLRPEPQTQTPTQKMRFEPLPLSPSSRPSPLETCEKRVESETRPAPSRAVPRDTRPEMSNPNKRSSETTGPRPLSPDRRPQATNDRATRESHTGARDGRL